MNKTFIINFCALLAVVFLSVNTAVAQTEQPYAIFSADGKTLTFKYGEKPDGAFDLYNDEGNPGWSNEIEVETVTKVVFDDSFKDARPTSCYFWFGSVPYITEIVGMKENLNTSEVTGMTGMFAGCNNLTTIDLSGFDTKNVTSMYDMFWYCTSLTTLDLSSFNTENVTNMEGMFENCTNLTSLNLSGLDTKHVTSMNKMFLGCENLTTIIVGDNWSTANVTNGDDMFNYCNSLVGGNGTTYDANHIDKTYAIIDGKNGNPGYLTNGMVPYVELSSDGKTLTFKYDADKPETGAYDLNEGKNSPDWWIEQVNITKVVFDESFKDARPTTCYMWFARMTNLTEIVGMKENLNTEKVTNMYEMFYGCEKLTTLDLSNFKTDNVTDMVGMFEYCSGLTNLNLNRFNTGNVTNMERMFNSCSNLNVLDISSFNTENVTNMEYMFSASAETILIGKNWNTEQVTKCDHMFTNCLSLIGNYGLWGAQLETLYDKTYAHANKGGLLTTGKYKIFYLLDNDLQKYYTDENSELKFETFTNSVNEFGGSEVTLVNPEKDNAYFDYWVDLLEYNRSLLGGTAPNHLPTITLSANDVGNRIYIAFWIYPYAVLSEDKKTLTFYFDKEKDSKVGTKYDLNDGETTPAWSSEAENITKVIFDESFAEARPTSCFEWFYDMTNLTEIVGMKDNLNTSDVTNMMDMFYGCEKLTTLDLSNFNTENVTDMTHMFSHCEKLTAIKVGSGWDANGVTSHNYMFSACIALIGNEGVWVSSTNKTNANTLSTGYLTSDNYKVFLDPDGGTLTGGNVINVTSEVTLPEPTKSGHQFLGWVRQLTSATYESSTSTNVTVAENDGNRWYKAHWAVMKSYVVLSDDSKTLTFKCGESIPDGAYSLSSVGWKQNTNITKVVFDETFQYARPTQCSEWFYGLSNLSEIVGMKEYLNTEKVTTMNWMFRDCKKITAIDLSGFKTDIVTKMGAMFYNCENLTVLDLRGFNTEMVTDVGHMFAGCKKLTTVLIGDNWKTDAVTTQGYMFSSCSSLIGNDGTKVGADVGKNCAHADAGGYLTKNDYKIFYKWADDKTGAYQTQYTPSTFNGATAVTINNPDDRGYDFLYWTQVSAKGTQIGESSANLTISAGDLGNKIYVMHWRVPQPYAELSSDNKTLTFKYGDKPDGAYDIDEWTSQTIGSKNVDVLGWYTHNESVTKVVFDETFAEARPLSCYNWFYGLTNLKTISGINNLNTSEVSSMRGMFDKCKSLESVDLSYFTTNNLTNIRAMFCDCEKLSTLDLRTLNTGEVTEAQYMFQNCTNLTTILVDDTKWDLSKVTASDNHKGMFQNCTALIGNGGATVGSETDRTNANTSSIGYLTKDNYKIFYKWADEDGYKTQYTPSTYNSSITPLTIDPPNDREGYNFEYWTRVSASGEQIGGSSATLTIAAGDVGNRIYQMNWTVDVTAIADTRFRGKPSGNLDEIHVCGSEFQMSANEIIVSGAEGSWSLSDGSSAEDYIAASDIHNPSATVKNIPNSGVTLKWTITDGTNSDFDEITIYNEKAETSVTVPEYSCDGTVTLSADITSSDYTCRWSTEADGTFSSNTAEIVKTKEGASVTFSGMRNGITTIFTWNLVHKVSVTDGERTYDECLSDDKTVMVKNIHYRAEIEYPDTKNKLICIDEFNLSANDVSIYDDGTHSIRSWWTSNNDAVIKYNSEASNSFYRVEVSDLPIGETVFTWHVEGFGCAEVTDFVTIMNGTITTVSAGDDDFTCTDEYELHADELKDGQTGYWQLILGDFDTENFVNSTNNVVKLTGLRSSIGEYLFRWTVKSADYYGQNGCTASDNVKINANGFTVYANGEEKNSQFSNCGSEGSVNGIRPTGEWTGEWTSTPTGLIVGENTNHTFDFDLGTNKSAVFKWTVTKGGCTDSDEVTVTNIKPKAETKQSVYYACGEDPVTLSGILPENTTGEWDYYNYNAVSSGRIVGATDISNAQYRFTSDATNTSVELEWTVTSTVDDYCSATVNVTVINNRYEPTITAPNYVCGSETSVEGTIPESGFNGYWICTSSTHVTFDESTNKQTTVKNLQPGENTIQWTVYNAEGERCNSVSEEYVIENIKVVPTVADVDPTFDGTFTVALSASSLSDYGIVGSDIFGRWETVSAPISVNILNSTNNETEVSGLTETGDYEFKWVVYRKIAGFPEETGYSDGGNCHTSKTVKFTYEIITLSVDMSDFTYGSTNNPKVTATLGTEVTDVTDVCEKLYTDESGQSVVTDLASAPVGKYMLKATYLGVSSSTTFNILPKAISSDITLSQTEFVYDGSEKTPTVILKDGENLLVENTDFTVAISNPRKNVGTYRVIVSGRGNFTGRQETNFKIIEKSIEDFTVTLSETSYDYDGTAKTPSVTVSNGDRQLIENTDYVVTMPNSRVNAGEYTVTFSGKGNYTGEVERKFVINKIPLKIVANDNTIVYGDEPSDAGVRYYGFITGQNQRSLQGELTFDYTYSKSMPAGYYKITPKGYSSNNYEITYGDGILKVKGLFPYVLGKNALVKLPVSVSEDITFSSSNPDVYIRRGEDSYLLVTTENVKKGDFYKLESEDIQVSVTIVDPFENYFDENKWYNQDVVFSCPENNYNWTLKTENFENNTITKEDENSVKCIIEDENQNVVASKEYLVKIDKTAPEISALVDGHSLENSNKYFFRTGAEFSVSASDNFSGLETLEYSWDNEFFKQYDGKITLPYGKSIVYVRSKDVAANQSEIFKADFSVFEDSKFLDNGEEEITSDTIFYSSKSIHDMGFSVDLNGNSVGIITDKENNVLNFSVTDNIITVNKEYLETLSPGINPLYVRINPLGDQSAWLDLKPADFQSQILTINLDVKYIVFKDKNYIFQMEDDTTVNTFCQGDYAIMKLKFDDNYSAVDYVTVNSLGIDKESPDGGIKFQVPFDDFIGGNERLLIQFYKDNYVYDDTIVLPVNYPSQRNMRVYDDVLAIDNYDSEFMDGCYEWYVDNKRIDGADMQFLDLRKYKFDNQQHIFSVSVLNKAGDRFRVCPNEDFIISDFSDKTAFGVTLYPNPALSGQEFYIKLEGFSDSNYAEMEILIFNQLGSLVERVTEVQKETSVVLPEAGFFSGVVVLRGQKVLYFKIVVE